MVSTLASTLFVKKHAPCIKLPCGPHLSLFVASSTLISSSFSPSAYCRALLRPARMTSSKLQLLRVSMGLRDAAELSQLLTFSGHVFDLT